MNSLILDLQKRTVETNCSVTELLRMASIVATKLNIDELKLWIKHELEGYPDDIKVPKYRIITGTPYAVDRYNCYERVLLHNLTPDKVESLSTFYFKYPIYEIESMLKNSENDNNGAFAVHYDAHTQHLLMNAINSLVTPVLRVERHRYQGIVEAVKNTILRWTLELEASGVMGHEMQFSEEEKTKAPEVTKRSGILSCII